MGIVCEKISKHFGMVVAIEEANITIREGEIRALLGGNGSGKSTLVNLISGVVKPNSGKITFNEEEYVISGPSAAKKKGVIMTSQELSLLENLTVAENISLCHIPGKGGMFTDRKKISSTARDILEQLGLVRIMNKHIIQLTPNEKYMVEFAKALVQNPKVLLIDEITSALFKDDVEKVREALFRLRDQGCAIVFISHRMQEVFDICDTITVMRNGRTVADMKASEADEATLLSLMTGREVKEIEDQETSFEDETSKPGKTSDTMLSVKGMRLPGFDNSIDLDVAKGEIVCIAGLQGHGQSELVRCLFGMYSHIDMEINNQPVTITSPRQAVKHGFAFISGDREKEGVFREQNISQNLNSVRRNIFNDKSKDDVELLGKYGVKYDNPKQKLTQLSGGNQQKVVIGKWMSVTPRILLADDPTKGIDVNAREDVHRMIMELSDHGSSIIFFSCDDSEIISLAHKAKLASVAVVYEGRIVKRLRGRDITEDNISKASMQIAGGNADE